MAPLGGNLDPFGCNFGSGCGPYGLKNGDMAGPIRNPQSASKRRFSLVFSIGGASFEGCEAVATGAKLRHVRTDLDVLHHMASIWNPSGALGPTNWRQLGRPRKCNLGHLGPFGRANLAASIRHVDNLPILPPFPSRFAFDGGSCEASYVAHIGLVFTQDQVAHAMPNSRPNVPKLRHVGPQFSSSWAQVGAN